jgi:hypothetical protein
MVLPLRVWLDGMHADDAALHLAHTLDISPIGGRLGGLRTPVHPGQTLLLQRGQQKTRFRVVWTKQVAANEIQAGIEAMESGKKIWDVELPEPAAGTNGNSFAVQSCAGPSGSLEAPGGGRS